MNKKALKILVTALVVLGGTGFLVFTSMADAQYYKMVDELMVSPANYKNKTLRVHGYVEAGSIKTEIVDQKTTRVFVLESNGHSIRVHHEGPAPDTFREKSEVVAKGTLVEQDGTYVLQATELTAKCPSKYEGKPKLHDPTAGQQAKPIF